MKLRSILKEEGAMLTFRMTSPFQRALAVKIANGNLDYDNLSPKDWATLDSLQDLGLVGDDHQLTGTGQRLAELTKKFGGLDVKHAGQRDRKLGRTGGPAGRYTDNDDGEVATEEEPGAFQDQWGSVRDRDD
jgi:hypothetical protein